MRTRALVRMAVAVGLCIAAGGARGQRTTVWAWGYNYFGQLGLGFMARSEPYGVLSPGQVPLVGVTDAVAGGLHTQALTADGRLWACGQNDFGQLGLGNNAAYSSPTEVSFFTGRAVTGTWTGAYHALGRTSDDKLWAWGRNASGQLGLGHTSNRTTPTELTFFAGATVTALLAGGHHTMAITSGGTLWAWGSNGNGQLGLGDTTSRSTPTEVTLFTNTPVTNVRAGYYHTLAQTSDGRLWAWGLNYSGQLGLSNTVDRGTPTEVTSFTGMNVTGVWAGGHHTLAQTSGGRLWAWGQNGSGQLGLGHWTTRTVPTEVPFFIGRTVTGV